MRKTALACPVCGKYMDIITHHTQDNSGYGTALLGGDGRSVHRKESPSCAQHRDWVMGWNEIELKENEQ
jgi:hypothetical protein